MPMTSPVKSIYIKVSPEEAKQAWAASGPRLRTFLFRAETPVTLHFISALGGCVIAAVPDLPPAGRPSLGHLFTRYFGMSPDKQAAKLTQQMSLLLAQPAAPTEAGLLKTELEPIYGSRRRALPD